MKENERISLAIADDHKLLRNGLAQLLCSQGFDVVIEADNGLDLLRYLEHTSVDVALLDINMPEMDGCEAAINIRKKYPEIRTLALSMYDDDLTVIKMLRAGVRGYLLKDTDPIELQKAIMEVYNEGFYYSKLVNSHVAEGVDYKLDSKKIDVLNDQERQFLRHICSDLTYKEIASKMSVSHRTVDGYRDQIFHKLRLKSRTALVIFAIKEGIYKID